MFVESGLLENRKQGEERQVPEARGPAVYARSADEHCLCNDEELLAMLEEHGDHVRLQPSGRE